MQPSEELLWKKQLMKRMIFLKKMATNNYEWIWIVVHKKKTDGVYEAEAITNPTAQVAALTKMVQSTTLLQSINYDPCGSNHSSKPLSSEPV